jgi:hypothetical protein
MACKRVDSWYPYITVLLSCEQVELNFNSSLLQITIVALLVPHSPNVDKVWPVLAGAGIFMAEEAQCILVA